MEKAVHELSQSREVVLRIARSINFEEDDHLHLEGFAVMLEAVGMKIEKIIERMDSKVIKGP